MLSALLVKKIKGKRLTSSQEPQTTVTTKPILREEIYKLKHH